MAWKVELHAEIPQRRPRPKTWRLDWRAGIPLLILGAALLHGNEAPQPVQPAIASVPGRLEFGKLPVPTSRAKTVLVRNQGSSDLNVRFVGIAVEEQSDFRVTGTTCEGAPLPPGHTCRIRTVFHPSALSRKTAKLLIADNAGDSPQSVTLIGTGVEGDEATHQTSAWKDVELHNTGQATVMVKELYLPHDNDNFKLDPRNCLHKTMAGGEHCAVKVQYTPTLLPSGASCTPELVLQENMGHTAEEKRGELVVKVCQEVDESTSYTVQQNPCQYTGITFAGVCVPGKP